MPDITPQEKEEARPVITFDRRHLPMGMGNPKVHVPGPGPDGSHEQHMEFTVLTLAMRFQVLDADSTHHLITSYAKKWGVEIRILDPVVPSQRF